MLGCPSAPEVLSSEGSERDGDRVRRRRLIWLEEERVGNREEEMLAAWVQMCKEETLAAWVQMCEECPAEERALFPASSQDKGPGTIRLFPTRG